MNIRRRYRKKPNLIGFIHFVNNETLIVSDPIFSKQVVSQYTDKKPNSRRTKVSSFAIKDGGKVHVEGKLANCIYCREDHILNRCNAFMNQTLKDRIKFLAKKKKKIVMDVYN